MIILFEEIVMCFILLLFCVVDIKDRPIRLVTFFENDVKGRVVRFRINN